MDDSRISIDVVPGKWQQKSWKMRKIWSDTVAEEFTML